MEEVTAVHAKASAGLGSGAQRKQASSPPARVPRPQGAVPHHSLGWQAPRAGEDVVLLGEEPEHAVQVASQQVLAAQLDHAWEVVDFLEVVQKNPSQQSPAGMYSPSPEESVCMENQQ